MFNRRAISNTDIRLFGKSVKPSAHERVFSAMALSDVILVGLRAAQAGRGNLVRRSSRNG